MPPDVAGMSGGDSTSTLATPILVGMRFERPAATRPGAGGVAIAALALATVIATTTASQGSRSDAAAPSPDERLSISDLEYRGAFRLDSDTFGASSVNYAVGTLAFNSENESLFIAGHAQQNAVAEFAVPSSLGTASVVADLPVVETPLQDFATFLDDAPTGNPDGINRIDGMQVDDGRLIVNAERWYDASGTARDTTLVLDAADIDGPVDGYFELEGAVHAGGYISDVPTAWRSALGGPLLTGWAANTSIVSRHSVGPSLFTFDPADLSGDPTVDPSIDTSVHMNFPYSGQRWITPDALDTHEPGDNGGASRLWNHLSQARFGFIAPGTSTFVVVGSTGGVESGIGYKITQDDGTLCGGYCAYASDDSSNAYWLFDVNEILAADEVHLPRPYASGAWSVPFDDEGRHAIIGGAFDADTSRLYLALGNAGQVGTYDRPPLIVVYDVADTAGPFLIDRPATVLEPAVRHESAP